MRTTRFARTLLLSFLTLGCPAPAPAQVPIGGGTTEELQAFVRRRHVHGLPYTAGRAFGSFHVPTLRRMLHDPDEQAHLCNVVLMLGLIGDASVSADLIDLLEQRFDGPVDRDRFLGLMTVNVALGNLANRGEARARLYLLGGADRAFWGSGQLRWSKAGLSARDRDDLLSKMAIFGLALAGTPDARARLLELDAREVAAFRPNLREALTLHERIVRDGIDQVFATRDR